MRKKALARFLFKKNGRFYPTESRIRLFKTYL